MERCRWKSAESLGERLGGDFAGFCRRAAAEFFGQREAQAIDVVQPRQRKRASAIRPSTMRAESFSMSPQTGLLTSTLPWRRTVLDHFRNRAMLENCPAPR